MQDLNDKVTGNTLTAAEWNQVPSEIQNVIEGLGITLSGGDLNQLGKAVAGYVANGTFYTDSGAADAYVLSVVGSKQNPTEYTDGFEAEFVVGNTSTGSSTVNIAGLGVKDITGTSSAGVLTAGDIVRLRYNTTSGEFDIVGNTGTQIDLPAQIQSITATVAASALTLGVKADSLEFRNATLTNGLVADPIDFADLSLVVPSGATLGTISASESNLILVAINNAGTVELAVINLSGGNDISEVGVITTVAIDATSDSNNVFYSTVARSNVPYRVVGLVRSTQATAGTWATSPTLIQGAGGRALVTIQSLGVSQTWQDVSGSRSGGVVYTNTTGRPIEASIVSAGSTTREFEVSADGSTNWIAVGKTGSGSDSEPSSFIVPVGWSYRANGGISSIDSWAELR